MTRELTVPNVVQEAVAVLTDPQTPVVDKAALYGPLHGLQLYVNRALRKVKDELVLYMEHEGLKALGPLTVKETDEADYICNQESNWGDATVQDTMRYVIAPIAPEFVKHVPEHYEIRTAELGRAVHDRDPVAMQLWHELTDRGWRRVVQRRVSIAVAEAKAPKAKVAA